MKKVFCTWGRNKVMDFRVRNTATLAAALGVGVSSIVRSRRGSSELSQLMSSSAVNVLRGNLTDKINEKLSALQQSIEAIDEGSERGVSILDVLRQSEIPVMTLLDELKNIPSSNKDPISFLKGQGFPEDFLEKLGLQEGISKSECQEILSRHLQGVLRGVGINEGVRNLCKLAVHGEEHYRNRSSALKAASTATHGISNIAAKPMVWIAYGAVNLVAKIFSMDSSKLPDTQSVKAISAVAAAALAICISICPPIAIAVGVMYGVFLLFRGISSLLELANESFAKSCLEGKDDAWSQFFSNLSRKILETINSVAPAVATLVGAIIPGTTGQILEAAAEGEGSLDVSEGEAVPEKPATVPAKENSAPSRSEAAPAPQIPPSLAGTGAPVVTTPTAEGSAPKSSASVPNPSTLPPETSTTQSITDNR
jgi:hypothetical protein